MNAKHSKPKKSIRSDLGDEQVRLSAYLPAELARTVRVQAAMDRCSVSSLVAIALEEHLR